MEPYTPSKERKYARLYKKKASKTGEAKPATPRTPCQEKPTETSRLPGSDTPIQSVEYDPASRFLFTRFDAASVNSDQHPFSAYRSPHANTGHILKGASSSENSWEKGRSQGSGSILDSFSGENGSRSDGFGGVPLVDWMKQPTDDNTKSRNTENPISPFDPRYNKTNQKISSFQKSPEEEQHYINSFDPFVLRANKRTPIKGKRNANDESQSQDTFVNKRFCVPLSKQFEDATSEGEGEGKAVDRSRSQDTSFLKKTTIKFTSRGKDLTTREDQSQGKSFLEKFTAFGEGVQSPISQGSSSAAKRPEAQHTYPSSSRVAAEELIEDITTLIQDLRESAADNSPAVQHQQHQKPNTESTSRVDNDVGEAPTPNPFTEPPSTTIDTNARAYNHTPPRPSISPLSSCPSLTGSSPSSRASSHDEGADDQGSSSDLASRPVADGTNLSTPSSTTNAPASDTATTITGSTATNNGLLNTNATAISPSPSSSGLSSPPPASDISGLDADAWAEPVPRDDEEYFYDRRIMPFRTEARTGRQWEYLSTNRMTRRALFSRVRKAQGEDRRAEREDQSQGMAERSDESGFANSGRVRLSGMNEQGRPYYTADTPVEDRVDWRREPGCGQQ